MTAMDPKGVADVLRPMWKKEPPPAPHPEDRHSLTFLEAVCKELDVEPSVINVNYVAKLMGKADLDMHEPDEYPKMPPAVKNKENKKFEPVLYPDDHELAGQPVIFYSKEDEDAFGNPNAKPAGEIEPPPPNPNPKPKPELRPADAYDA